MPRRGGPRLYLHLDLAGVGRMARSTDAVSTSCSLADLVAPKALAESKIRCGGTR